MKKVAAVTVTYNNAGMLRGLLEDLLGQTRPLDEVIVVDNASSDGTDRMMGERFPGVRYLRLPENEGSAGGYCEGVRLASEGSDLVWTLDDDVRLRPDSLGELLRGMEALEELRKIGAVRSVGEKHPQSLPTQLDIIPWRGSLIKTDAVRELGLPRKEYFIYGEDLEYSLRLRKAGYVFFWIPSSRCVERRGGKTDDTFLGKAVRIYPTAFRLYYAFRNECNIYLEYRRAGRLACVFLYAAKVAVYLVVSEGCGGFGKIRAIAAGLIDGLRGRLGRNAEYLPA